MATFVEVRKRKILCYSRALLFFDLFGNHSPRWFVCVSEIILPSTYKNSVRGLCGNYDGITKNEYMKPDGTVIRNLNEFGESWRVTDRQAEGLRTYDLPKSIHAHR